MNFKSNNQTTAANNAPKASIWDLAKKQTVTLNPVRTAGEYDVVFMGISPSETDAILTFQHIDEEKPRTIRFTPERLNNLIVTTRQIMAQLKIYVVELDLVDCIGKVNEHTGCNLKVWSTGQYYNFAAPRETVVGKIEANTAEVPTSDDF